MQGNTKMITFENIAVIVTVTTTTLTYLVLALAENIGSFEIGVVEKFGGAGLAGILAYLLIRWLFKRNDDLQKKLEELHQNRMDEQKKHCNELIDEIKKKS